MRLTHRPYKDTPLESLVVVVSAAWGTKFHRAARQELDKMYTLQTIDDIYTDPVTQIQEAGRDIVTKFVLFGEELEHPMIHAVRDELNQRLAMPP